VVVPGTIKLFNEVEDAGHRVSLEVQSTMSSLLLTDECVIASGPISIRLIPSQ